MDFLQSNYVVIVVALLAVSEVLAVVPGIKANSIFQLIVAALMSMKPKK